MKHKILIFSHRSDNDGATPIILSKLAFSEVDFILEEPSTIDEKFLKVYEEGKFDHYDLILVTDLCIGELTADKIQADSKNQSKVLVFDHHHSKLHMNRYPFISVIDEKEGIKECGSSLYYEYLIANYANSILEKPVVREMVELVRLLDTWTWKDKNVVEAKWIGNLFGIYGIEYYIEYYYQFCLQHEHFEFQEKQKYLLEVEDVRIQNYIEKKEKEIHAVQLKEYYVGIVFAELYRSELGNVLAEKYQDLYDFIIVINISRSVSYRGVKEIDLGKFAGFYGGAGHQKAAGSPLPNNLLENIIQLIFKDSIIK